MGTNLQSISFRCFLALDRLGLHVLPKHFYTPVPDYAWLRQNQEFWTAPATLYGVHWDLDEQLAWLRRICEPYRHEVAGLSGYEAITQGAVGPGYGPIESQVLHCFIRSYRPRRIVEIGSGVSTFCMLAAAERNAADGGRASAITCVEPYPSRPLSESRRIKLLQKPCQTAAFDIFDALGAEDLLFIDSSHAVKVGSDVVRIYLDIVPRLAAGVLIHIHDIYLPYLYSRSTLSHWFGASQETALLLALLTHNPHLRVLASLSALHYDRSSELKAILPDYNPRANVGGLHGPIASGAHFPNSIWLQTV